MIYLTQPCLCESDVLQSRLYCPFGLATPLLRMYPVAPTKDLLVSIIRLLNYIFMPF